ncbi:MAG: Do family serine endopeptidase [Candidatus Hydrogenedentota bacterium]|nr:MAG: Do family serine endopeptidase [Candidatus Hydrogenedentota bacterium]
MKAQKATVGLVLLACSAFILTLPTQSWAAAGNALRSIEISFVEIAEKVKPSVVHVTTKRRPLKGLKEKMDEEDFFKMFPFPHIDPDQFRAHAAGSGVIMDKTGYILTNNHLVEDSEEISVKISDFDGDRGKEYEGRVIARDPATDLAVIKIEPDRPLSEVKLGDSSALKVGQWAIAIGDPFGLEKTFTVGVISGLGRYDFGGPLRNVMYQNFIQTDASINPGNSGGPLLDINGEVIGINTFIQGSGTGIGFAIPINMVKEVYEQLVEHGEVIRGFLGVKISDMDEGLAAALKVPDLDGALIVEVISGTPADRAGLRHGDVIRTVDGQEISNSKMLQQTISHKRPGQKVRVVVLREGEQKKFTVELTKLTAQLISRKPPAEEKNLIGLTVEEIPEQLARPGEKGVIVTEVESGGAAEKGGLAGGDIILEINMQQVSNVNEFQEIINKLKPGEWVSFYLRRGDQTLYKAVKISPNG